MPSRLLWGQTSAVPQEKLLGSVYPLIPIKPYKAYPAYPSQKVPPGLRSLPPCSQTDRLRRWAMWPVRMSGPSGRPWGYFSRISMDFLLLFGASSVDVWWFWENSEEGLLDMTDIWVTVPLQILDSSLVSKRLDGSKIWNHNMFE